MEPLINAILYFVFLFGALFLILEYCIGFINRGRITSNLEEESIIPND